MNFKECDAVRLTTTCNGYPAGTTGTVVSVYPQDRLVDLKLHFPETGRYELPDEAFPDECLELEYRP